MKKIVSLLLAIVPVLALAQEKYVIQGKISNLNTRAVAYLSYPKEHEMKVDSSVITDGTFRFTGQVDAVTQAMLVVVRKTTNPRSDGMHIYLANGITVINTP